ncbi:hypothetical protein J7E93_09590 [Streptomyces sp. ISL-36]|uniref:DUF6882 domain-containing protein n=1 Tax=Streptomyces sp. ISL-36 TaxID=2819182 RepID=UPI001BEC5BEF|nr:DUF6882 domain-containing protein [Streptomyces sp. ISL-36]MBT2440356.1 hypothetical protein [Streptomyces sp. ISL-36]
MVTGFSDRFLLEAERHAAWGAAQLDTLTGFLPDGPWSADLPSCVYRQGGLTLRVAVLGTYDTAERSWMWGWANPGLRDTPVVALAEQVRAYGQRHGIGEFEEEVQDLSGFADPDRAAETLAFAGMGVTGAPGYIGVVAGPDTRVYFLPQDPQVPRATVDPVSLPRTLMTAVGLIGRSPRHVVTGYFDHHGLGWHEDADLVSARLPDGSGAEVEFDTAGRIANIRMTVQP